MMIQAYYKIVMILLIPMGLWAGFDTDPQKVEVLRHFDIPSSFLSDDELYSTYTKKRKIYLTQGLNIPPDEMEMLVPLLASMIDQSDLPREFLFVSIVESKLNAQRSSYRGASGIWQFVERTGRKQGLSVNQFVDERRDHIKSTQAAIAYLSKLKQIFGKWYLALIAYNCGDGRLRHAIARAGSTDLWVLLDPRQGYLPRESRNYIRKVVALALLGTDQEFLSRSNYGILLQKSSDNPVVAVYLPEGEEIDRIASVLEMPQRKLSMLNTHLRKGLIPPTNDAYPMYIPKEKMDTFLRDYRTKDAKDYLGLHQLSSRDALDQWTLTRTQPPLRLVNSRTPRPITNPHEPKYTVGNPITRSVARPSIQEPSVSALEPPKSVTREPVMIPKRVSPQVLSLSVSRANISRNKTKLNLFRTPFQLRNQSRL